MKEEDEYYEEDSAMKENRLRRVDDFNDDDVGNEGNKSTYLRPSKMNKNVNGGLNRTQNSESVNEM